MTPNDHRPFLIFRKTRSNRYTLPSLLGGLEADGRDRFFRIRIASTVEEILEKAAGEKGIVAFSFMTPHFLQVKSEVKRLRQALGQEVTFIAGGSHATGDPEGARRLGFDFVFVGEADRTFPAFLDRFLDGNLPGTSILAEEKPLAVFPPGSPFFLAERFFAPIEITRGCLFGCGFCQTPRIFGHHLRHRSPAEVAGHLRRAIPYGYLKTSFISSNSFSYGSTDGKGPNLAAIEEFLGSCREAGSEGLLFGCYPSEVRPDWVNPEVLQLVRKHCRNATIVLGAQSGSDSLLTKLNRGHDAERAMTAARWIRQAGFMPHVDFVFGFPDETPEDRRLSLRLMERMIGELDAKIHAHTFMPLPATPLFRREPTRLDGETRQTLIAWEKRKKLDGWWQEQEKVAWEIVRWRDEGLIGAGKEA